MLGSCIAIIAPLGLVMGMPFPQGLRRAGQGSLAAPPFYWGLNGILSVVGSVGTVVIALTFGFRAAMIAGAVCYIVAALASEAAGELSISVPNASTRLKKLVADGYLRRVEAGAESGGIEFKYEAIR